MNLPEELSRALRVGQEELAAQAQGSLPLANRRRIWRALGPAEMDGERAIVSDGLHRRVALGELAVRRVLPTWERAFPNDGRVASMLTTARRRVAGEINWDDAWEEKNDFWARLDDLLGEGDDPAAVYVGYAAADVVNTALYDQPGSEVSDDVQASDESLDPYEWDASYYASLAAAGGAAGEEGSDPARRRTFWQWYLSEAVPSAWAAAVA